MTEALLLDALDGIRQSKTCFRCGATKPLDEFYGHRAMADRHLNKCKGCTKADVRAYPRADIERWRAYDRGRAMLPRRVEARALSRLAP
jgi:hypothetical protein